MEGKDAEKPKVKPEADYSFDPISADASMWDAFLSHAVNFEKDFTRGEWPFKTPASTILEKVRAAGTPRAVIEIAVERVLHKWEELAGLNKFSIETNPIEFVASLGDEATIDVVQRLWTDAPENSPLRGRGQRFVVEGLGINVPLDQEGLEELYAEQFDLYSFTALEIMLKRKKFERASVLFDEHVHMYSKGNDPVMLDYLVGLGLPVASAKKWLDQSVNAEPRLQGHYDEALVRWEKIHGTI